MGLLPTLMLTRQMTAWRDLAENADGEPFGGVSAGAMHSSCCGDGGCYACERKRSLGVPLRVSPEVCSELIEEQAGGRSYIHC